MDVQTDTELNGHNADNRKIGIDVCNPLSSNYMYDTMAAAAAMRYFFWPTRVSGRMKNGNSV